MSTPNYELDPAMRKETEKASQAQEVEKRTELRQQLEKQPIDSQEKLTAKVRDLETQKVEAEQVADELLAFDTDANNAETQEALKKASAAGVNYTKAMTLLSLLEEAESVRQNDPDIHAVQMPPNYEMLLS